MENLCEFIQGLSDDSLKVLNIIQKNGPLTINNLTDIMNVNRNRIQRLMQPLLNNKLIIPKDTKLSTGGRFANSYDINCSDYFVAGLNIGSVRYSISIVDLKHQRILSKQFSMNASYTPHEFVELTHIQLQELLKEVGISYNQLIGLGIGIAGAIKKDEGILHRQHSDFFHRDWINAPIRQLFRETFSLPVEFDLTISADMLDHYYYGVGRESERLMIVHCSMSITNGFILNGQLARALNDHQDALAHMTIDIDGMLCRCGNYGCIDCYSSVQAIVNRFTSEVKIGKQTIIQKSADDITIKDITQAANLQDSLAKNVIGYAARVLGCGLANYIRLLNPDTVILLGIMIDESDHYFEELHKTVTQRLSYDLNDLKINFIKVKKSEQVFSDSAAVLFIEQLLNPSGQLIPRITKRNTNHSKHLKILNPESNHNFVIPSKNKRA